MFVVVVSCSLLYVGQCSLFVVCCLLSRCLLFGDRGASWLVCRWLFVVVCFWLVVVSCLLLVVVFVICCAGFDVCCVLFVVCFLCVVMHCLYFDDCILFVNRCLSCVVCCRLFVVVFCLLSDS